MAADVLMTGVWGNGWGGSAFSPLNSLFATQMFRPFAVTTQSPECRPFQAGGDAMVSWTAQRGWMRRTVPENCQVRLLMPRIVGRVRCTGINILSQECKSHDDL